MNQPEAAGRHEFAPLRWASRLKIVLIKSLSAWVDHRGDSKGAALAFYTLFSMMPILVLVIAIAGYFFGAEAAQGEIVAHVQGFVGPHGARAIQTLLAAARDPAAGMLATLVASVLLLLSATSVFVELKASLDEFWGIPKPCKSAFRGLLRARLLSFGLVLILAFLLLVSLVVSAVLSLFQSYSDAYWNGPFELIAMLASLVSISVITSLFAVIFKTLPNAPLSWLDAWIGAFFTAGLFSLGKLAIGLYLGNTGVLSTFGAAGSLIALLLWVYYSAQIFFLGAAFTRQFALEFGSLRSRQPAPPPTPAQRDTGC